MVAQDGASAGRADHQRRQGLPLSTRSGRRTASTSPSAIRMAGCWSVIAGGPEATTEIAHSHEGEIQRLRLVAGRRISGLQHERSGVFPALYIWCVGRQQAAPGDRAGCSTKTVPAWDPDGDYLYFIANHEFHPQISQIEFDFATNRSRGIFVLALRKDVKNPFPPESDEVTLKAADDGEGRRRKPRREGQGRREGQRQGRKDKAEAKDGGIDFDGLDQRVARVPLDAEQLFRPRPQRPTRSSMASPPRRTTAARRTPSRRCASSPSRTARRRRWSTISAGLALSHDGSKVLVAPGPICGTSMTPRRPAPASKKTVSTAGLMLERVPADGMDGRSSTKSGGATAISSTRPTCTATIGKRFASATASCCRTWRIAPI